MPRFAGHLVEAQHAAPDGRGAMSDSLASTTVATRPAPTAEPIPARMSSGNVGANAPNTEAAVLVATR